MSKRWGRNPTDDMRYYRGRSSDEENGGGVGGVVYHFCEKEYMLEEEVGTGIAIAILSYGDSEEDDSVYHPPSLAPPQPMVLWVKSCGWSKGPSKKHGLMTKRVL